MAEPIVNLPCLDCDEGALARREIASAYRAMRRGRPPPPASSSNPLPESCCRRRGEFEVGSMVA